MLRRFFQNHLRSATPPTPEQPDFIWETNPEFRPVARQNPPVLQPLETVCSRSKHPLSGVSGRRRYNTLDFPTENRVPTGRFHPYWKPRSKGTCSPFTIPARLRICGHKLKNSLQTQIHKRKKSQSVPPSRRGILWDFHYAAFFGTREIHASRIALAMHSLNSCQCSIDRKTHLFYQPIFYFDSIQFLQHRLSCNQNEDYSCGSMDQIHGKARHIVGFQHFPVKRLGIIHQRSGGIHNAAVDYNR